VPGAVLGRARDRGQAVLCHAQDELQQPLEQRAIGRPAYGSPAISL
jgi:hypothetical protein